MDIKYPEVEVQLSGTDGNAFSIIGRAAAAMKRHGVPQEEIETFQQEATSGDYDNLIGTVCEWVSVS